MCTIANNICDFVVRTMSAPIRKLEPNEGRIKEDEGKRECVMTVCTWIVYDAT